MRPAFTVRAVRRQGIKGIRDGDDARAQRNLAAAKVSGVSAAAPALVVMKNHQAGSLKAVDVADRHPSELRMFFDPFELTVGQTSLFQQHIVGNSYLADIVQ